MAGNNFNVPDDSDNDQATGTGVLLQTIAVANETPLFSALPTPGPDATVQNLINNVVNALQVPLQVTFNITNEPRLQREIRREFFVSKHGLRDTQWSLRRAFAQARELIYIESPQFAQTARPADPFQPKEYEVDLVAELAQRLEDSQNLKVVICIPREPDFATPFKGWWRQHYFDRNNAISILMNKAPERVVVFHPVGFPGRTAFIRTTSIIVDDVWCLAGSTHFRRRGMTFDGSSAIASFDRELRRGYSHKVREYRRELMAAKLQSKQPGKGITLNSEWIRLGQPLTAFNVVKDLLAQGGLGRIQPLYPGPADDTVQAQGPNVADPDGSTSGAFFAIFAGVLNESGM